MGRLPVNPSGYTTISLTLWPEHREILNAWAEAFECSQSEALRMVLAFAGSPDKPGARRAAAKVQREQQVIKAAIKRAVEEAKQGYHSGGQAKRG